MDNQYFFLKEISHRLEFTCNYRLGVNSPIHHSLSFIKNSPHSPNSKLKMVISAKFKFGTKSSFEKYSHHFLKLKETNAVIFNEPVKRKYITLWDLENHNIEDLSEFDYQKFFDENPLDYSGTHAIISVEEDTPLFLLMEPISRSFLSIKENGERGKLNV